MSMFKEREEVIDEAYRIQGSHSLLQSIQWSARPANTLVRSGCTGNSPPCHINTPYALRVFLPLNSGGFVAMDISYDLSYFSRSIGNLEL
ncbi:hypothetical protein CsSME_00000232 [Camellia sinensis var. sinensis]